MDLPDKFEAVLKQAAAEFRRITEPQAIEKVTPSGWTRKNVIGHLIDSCLNNHLRFVRATLDGSYEGPPYHQQGWVNIHGYADMPWQTLVDYWTSHNQLMLEVVRRIPKERYSAPCNIAEDCEGTLEFIVQDYLVHMQHHVDQIRTTHVFDADDWYAAWNSHDLDRILAHYTDDIEFHSPFAIKLTGSPVVKGKAAVREYFTKALAAYPDLHFTPELTLTGEGSVVLYYQSVNNLLTAEMMELDDRHKVIRVRAHYGRK